ncbi:alpha-amylase [Candidatus Micrarchaeota archaeon]|nr:MAG: alpha-amylase [Candidatus Micrarchaeota archaeon]
MTHVVMYFHVHQPHRLRQYSVFDIGNGTEYFDKKLNKEIFLRAARKCYFPSNRLLLDLIEKYEGKFKVSFSITGTWIEQAQEFEPELIQSFQDLVKTGHVDLLDETYYHSLAYLISEEEFKEQVKMHRKLFKELFNYKPKVFRNTEAMYSNDIARTVKDLGYKGIVAEGWHSYLGWRSPNYVYQAKGSKIKLFLRNYKLSDDISFRFSTPYWEEFPLTADKYAAWLAASPGEVINLFMDYETFGEHQWKETGIFDFMRHLPEHVLAYEHLDFVGINELIKMKAVDEIDVPYYSSWADMDRDLSAWLGNEMQKTAFNKLKALESYVKRARDIKLKEAWRRLQTSDHIYYMCTKWWSDGDIHKYFSEHVESPYYAFMNFMNVLQDLEGKLMAKIIPRESEYGEIPTSL